MKAIKINNAVWLPQIAEHIEHFCRKAHVEGIYSSNLQVYFSQIAQGLLGKIGTEDTHEFWIVFNEKNKSLAFAAWQVLGLPHIAKVYCFAIHSWTKNRKVVDLLVDEFIKFGDKWNATCWAADFVNKIVMRLFMARAKKIGMEGKETQIRNVVFKRVA